MIKKLVLKFECKVCGIIILLERDIVIDQFTKKIEIIRNVPVVNREKVNFYYWI